MPEVVFDIEMSVAHHRDDPTRQGTLQRGGLVAELVAGIDGKTTVETMRTVDRAGVQFDMCPSCRGVWLDRGELEKLMAASDQPAPVAW